ncbi:cell wall metabolism sensor histidine kinase WalK [Paenibacillus sp. NFR01]|uniref:sensor histidine kinase n=1 Tax=Paenibacillus sp. NFR01 TaxID=1566279 RepID=UPI0008C57A37|nr:HAMP domain-containing sensor histidine kinase [Paenibacillus sp. NFR01]SET24768.1 HAMP domain-containing protein [Paenibacillus sp. NFR01]
MKRAGITAKLFIATAAFFILFYVIVLIAQVLVFPQFYEHRKMAKLEREAKQLASIYQNSPEKLRTPDAAVMRQLRRQDVNFVLTDFNGSTVANDPFRMRLTRPDQEALEVSLFYVFLADRPDFERLKLAAGDQVTLYGEYGEGRDRDIFHPYYIAKDSGSNLKGQVAGEKGAENEYDAVKGTIDTVSMPDLNKLGRRLGLLFLALDEFFPLSESNTSHLSKMEPVEFEWIDSFGGNRSAIRIQPVHSPSGEIELLLLVTSLQEIKETNSALRLFYAYLGAGGLVLIVLLSSMYSRLVTRPLLLLNQRAERMKRLDFSGEKPLQRKDELGNLSNTLFELSSKLDRTLEELNAANGQLKKEIEQNKELEQLQKDFFANASHELKTPLSIVRGFAEGMQDGISAGRQEHYIGVIIEESEKMERLVQDMLELLRLDSPALKLYRSPVLLSELTEDVLQRLTYRMREKGLTANIECSDEREVSVDAIKMEQVVLNLLTNAIRYAEPGSAIEIAIHGTGSSCMYSVHNKGESIPEPYLKRIWERFFRVEAARDRQSGGTGLGLAIVKRILELHDCEYKVENQDGGVIFTLTFRVAPLE